jgi:FSR family fosmidomycin resistance protein-like MFS transporter
MVILSFSHFIVDLSCALLVANVATDNMLLLLILYNFCAFALEMPLGIVIEDKFPPLKVASVGMGMILLSWIFFNIPMLALIIAGTGNALFHLGGGLSVMKKSTNAAPLGVFIGPGAAGIYLGAFLGKIWVLPTLVGVLFLAIVLWKTPKKCEMIKMKTEIFQGTKLAFVALFFLVVLRGFSGISQVFPWKEQWSIAFILVVILGKMVGGYLSDYFGAFRTGIVSLLVAAICFAFPTKPFFGLVGMFSFQLTMPITLWMLSKMTTKGFAFGILTFGLFIGSLPSLLNLKYTVLLSVFIIVSILLFVLGMRKEGVR